MAMDSSEFERFLGRYCVECHGGEETKGGVDFAGLDGESAEERRYLLELAHEQLRDDLMPPSKAEQPDPIERQAHVHWLEEQLALLDGFEQDDPGVVVIPRLTRTEFTNVLRDLTGVEMDLEDRLPPDYSAGEGFVNVGEAQSTTDAVVEKYLAATRYALSYARISPVSGITWFSRSLPEINDASEFRRSLIEDWVAVHFDSFERQVHGVSHQLAQEVGMVTGAYLHGAWFFRHRERLGMGDADLEEVARSYDPPLSAGVLAGWWSFLNSSDEDSLLIETLKQAWRDLPDPDDVDQGELMEQLVRLEEFAGPYHRRFDKFRERSHRTDVEKEIEYGEDARSARITVDCSGREVIHLVTTPHLGGALSNAATWSNGVLIMQDGSEKGWADAVHITDEQGKAVSWDRSGEQEEIRVAAPAVLRVELPADAEVLQLTATALEGESGVQMFVSSDPPEPAKRLFYPGRVGLFAGGQKSDAFRRYQEAVKDVWRLTFRPQNFESVNAFRGFDESYAPYLDFSFLKKETDSAGLDFSPEDAQVDRLRPFALTAAALRQDMNAAERERMQVLEQRFAREAPTPQWELHQFLRELGASDVQEGEWPDEATMQMLAKTSKGSELLDAVRDDEIRLFEQAKGLIREFTTKAWSMTPGEEQLEILLRPYRQSKLEGAPFGAAVKRSMQVVLLAPSFLYRLPPPQMVGQDPLRELTPSEYARRLSFFLWSTIPDEELVQKAESSALFEEPELRRQIGRMLADERSISLVREFAGVWLGFDSFPEDADPDGKLFPMFDEELKEAMKQETELFFAHLFRENRPLLDIIAAEYTFLNARLAEHYGIKGVDGEGFRRVSTGGYPRGGVLTQASLLTLKSKRLRTSPITRGEWILSSVLGVAIPEPPPDVPEISETEVNEEGLTIAQQLEAHRNSPACQSCHERIDPPGIVLESFDPVGRWRDRYVNGEEIETVAVFQRSESDQVVRSIDELKAHLVTHEAERFSRQVARKMFAYALGRPVLASDNARIDSIAGAVAANDYRSQELIYQIVTSPQFRLRREQLPMPLQTSNR